MTTVVDPAGTPVVFFNASGTAIVLDSGNMGSPVEIPALSGHVIVLATTQYNPSVGYSLSADFEVGDVVEIYPAFTPVGGTPGAPTSSPVFDENSTQITGVGYGLILRKIPSGLVRPIYGGSATTGNWITHRSEPY